MGDHQEDELLDYEEEDAEHEQTGNGAEAATDVKKAVKGSYVSIHSSGFRDFLLKPELLRAIVDCGFEHPSEGELISFHHVWQILHQVYTHRPPCDDKILTRGMWGATGSMSTAFSF